MSNGIFKFVQVNIKHLLYQQMIYQTKFVLYQGIGVKQAIIARKYIMKYITYKGMTETPKRDGKNPDQQNHAATKSFIPFSCLNKNIIIGMLVII